MYASERVDAGALFREHHAALLRYLERHTGDPDLAADAAQEAFVEMLQRPPRPVHLRAWLFKVGTNALRRVGRARTRRARLLAASPDRAPLADPPPSPDARLIAAEEAALIRAALARLSPRLRTVILLREEGFTHREIAEVVGTTTGSVGTMLARAFERLARDVRLDEEPS